MQVLKQAAGEEAAAIIDWTAERGDRRRRLSWLASSPVNHHWRPVKVMKAVKARVKAGVKRETERLQT